MMRKSLAFVVAVFGLSAACAIAQAPAGAPAGATGICTDGTYSTAASKSGACRGHNGVQTWYVPATPKTTAAATPAAPAPTPSTKPTPAMPAPTPSTAAPKSVPAPTATATPTPAAGATAPGKKLSPTQAAASKTAAPGGGPGLVWVNTATNVYHCNGDAFYGKTKAGAYMSEADAKAKGAHGEHGQICAGK